jgi:DNA-binding transcriptional LysR family regulator
MVALFFLKTFTSVAKTGSFKIAAERNFISQPAVSQHIRILEKKLGVVLFERQGKKTTLTEAGKVFLTYAQTILNQYEEAKVRVSETVKNFKGTIKIATIYSIGLFELQPVVKSFLRKYPLITVDLEYNHSEIIYEKVLNRTVDFGLVALPKMTPGITTKIFAENSYVLIEPAYRPIFKKRNISLKDLHEKNYVAFSSTTPTGRSISQFLRKNGVFPKIIQEYENIETLKSAVQIGCGCSLVPSQTITREKKEGTLLTTEVDNLTLKRPLGIIFPKGKIFTSSTKVFYEMIISKFKSKDGKIDLDRHESPVNSEEYIGGGF